MKEYVNVLDKKYSNVIDERICECIGWKNMEINQVKEYVNVLDMKIFQCNG